MSMESMGGGSSKNRSEEKEDVVQMLFTREVNELRMISEPKFDRLFGAVVSARGVKGNGYILEVNALLSHVSPDLRKRIAAYISSESETTAGEVFDVIRAELIQLWTDIENEITEGNLTGWNAK